MTNVFGDVSREQLQNTTGQVIYTKTLKPSILNREFEKAKDLLKTAFNLINTIKLLN